MLEILVVLCVLNMGVAAAALVLAVVGRRGAGSPPAAEGGPPSFDKGGMGAEGEDKPFKLNDRKMQEGIANLLAYEIGKSGEGEE